MALLAAGDLRGGNFVVFFAPSQRQMVIVSYQI
jgi:hypothetical protein